MNKGMYSSDRPDWETPQDFFGKLDRVVPEFFSMER